MRISCAMLLLVLAGCATVERSAPRASAAPHRALPTVSAPRFIEGSSEVRGVVEYDLRNDTDHVWYYGSRVRGDPSDFVESLGPAGWRHATYGMCGTGMRTFPLLPGESLTVRTGFVHGFVQGPLRVLVRMGTDSRRFVGGKSSGAWVALESPPGEWPPWLDEADADTPP